MTNTSKYLYVYPQEGNRMPWVAKPKAFRNGERVNLRSKSFQSEEEAAIYVDRILMDNGIDPVNILTEKATPSPYFDVREHECWITGGPRGIAPVIRQPRPKAPPTTKTGKRVHSKMLRP